MTQEAKPGARSAGDPTPGSGGPMGPTGSGSLVCGCPDADDAYHGVCWGRCLRASKAISVIVLEEGPRGLVLRESRVDVGSDVPGGGAA
jgi:hypothetical protein